MNVLNNQNNEFIFRLRKTDFTGFTYTLNPYLIARFGIRDMF